MDVVKSKEKKLSTSTDNSVSTKKVIRSDGCDGATIQGKTTGSREILNGRFMAYSDWIFVCFSCSFFC